MTTKEIQTEPADQPHHTEAERNGVIVHETEAALLAANPSTTYIFSSDYAHMVGPQLVQYRAGVSYVLTAAQISFLTANSAPMSLA